MIDAPLKYVDEMLQRDILANPGNEDFAFIGATGQRLIVYLYNDDGTIKEVARYKIERVD